MGAVCNDTCAGIYSSTALVNIKPYPQLVCLWWCVLWLQARRDAGMWNAGWNEVIWPHAHFHLKPEETVSPALPFSHTIISLTHTLVRSVFLTQTHTPSHPCHPIPREKRRGDIRNKFRKWQCSKERCYTHQSDPLRKHSPVNSSHFALLLNMTTNRLYDGGGNYFKLQNIKRLVQCSSWFINPSNQQWLLRL